MRQRSSYARAPREWYVEGVEATVALIAGEDYAEDGAVWDPACGQGNVIAAFAARRPTWFACGSDVVQRCKARPWFLGRQDFLETHRLPEGFAREGRGSGGSCHIVTNPPYGKGVLAEAFVRHALTLPVDTVAALVDLQFLASDGRARGLFAEHPPTRMHLIHPRISCPPGMALRRGTLKSGKRAAGGQTDYLWLVWDKRPGAKRQPLDWVTFRTEPGRDAA